VQFAQGSGIINISQTSINSILDSEKSGNSNKTFKKNLGTIKKKFGKLAEQA
jgi:hypothetical protein